MNDSQDQKEPPKDPKATKDAKEENLPPSQSKVGMINNLMSTDLDTLTNAREFFMLVGSVPIEIIFAVIFLYDLLGWASLVGIGMMVKLSRGLDRINWRIFADPR